MRRLAKSVLITIALNLGCVFFLFSQEKTNDYLFPGKGKFQATISTGVPYIGLAEGAYGFSNGFSAGVVVGITPNTTGYGIRLRKILYSNDDFRVFLRMPVLYYGRTKKFGDEPWILSWPTVQTEWNIKNAGRLSIGVGVVEAHCVDALLEGMGHHDDSMEMGFQGGFWNTFSSGFAWPVTQNITFQAELSVVMEGLKIAGSNYVGGPPVIFVLGLTKNF